MQERAEKKPVNRVKHKLMNLKEEQACTILITCGQPSLDGKMAVEMTYEGDPVLAAYLLERAPGFIDLDDGLTS